MGCKNRVSLPVSMEIFVTNQTNTPFKYSACGLTVKAETHNEIRSLFWFCFRISIVICVKSASCGSTWCSCFPLSTIQTLNIIKFKVCKASKTSNTEMKSLNIKILYLEVLWPLRCFCCLFWDLAALYLFTVIYSADGPHTKQNPLVLFPPQPEHGPGSTQATVKYRRRESRRLNVIHKIYSYSVIWI